MGSIEVGCDMVLELGHEQGSALSAAALVANGVLDLDLVKDGAVVELDKEGVSDGALLRVVVVNAELGLLHTVDLGTESVNAGIGSRCVSAGKIGLERGVSRWRTEGAH